MPDPHPVKLRHTRQGYREAAKRLAVMARRAEALLVALEDAPDDLRTHAEAAGSEVAIAWHALGEAARKLHH
jgi:hypothetical protein